MWSSVWGNEGSGKKHGLPTITEFIHLRGPIGTFLEAINRLQQIRGARGNRSARTVNPSYLDTHILLTKQRNLRSRILMLVR
jgi:hypothetical protein